MNTETNRIAVPVALVLSIALILGAGISFASAQSKEMYRFELASLQ